MYIETGLVISETNWTRVWRSFFEEVGDMFGNLKYKMHDLIHDLAESVAMVDCKLVDRDNKNVNEKIRHVSCPFFIGSSFNETLSLLVKAKKIRTFLLISNYSNELDEPMLNTITLNFRGLRALDIGGLEITRVPNSIEYLIHLKYLNLSSSSIITLLGAITRLWNLQTLEVFSCWRLKELPKDTKELVKLRHLDANECRALSNMPRGLGQLTCLQTLPLFVVSKDSSHFPLHHPLKDTSIHPICYDFHSTHHPTQVSIFFYQYFHEEAFAIDLYESLLLLTSSRSNYFFNNNFQLKRIRDTHPYFFLKMFIDVLVIVYKLSKCGLS